MASEENDPLKMAFWRKDPVDLAPWCGVGAIVRRLSSFVAEDQVVQGCTLVMFQDSISPQPRTTGPYSLRGDLFERPFFSKCHFKGQFYRTPFIRHGPFYPGFPCERLYIVQCCRNVLTGFNSSSTEAYIRQTDVVTKDHWGLCDVPIDFLKIHPHPICGLHHSCWDSTR